MKKSQLTKILALAGGVYLGIKLREFMDKDKKYKVKKLYHYWAKPYDWFMRYWNKFVASKVEKDLNDFLNKNIKKRVDVLDLACGTGQNIKRFQSQIKSYTGVDLSPEMQGKAREKAGNIKDAKFIIADITKFKSKNKFDIIICTWALSHMKKPIALIKKYLKYLRKGGYMILIFQGEFKSQSLLNRVFSFIENLFQAKLVAESEIENFPKALINKSYKNGYIRLTIFKN